MKKDLLGGAIVFLATLPPIASATGEPCVTAADCPVPAGCVVATCSAVTDTSSKVCGLTWPDLRTPSAVAAACG